MFTTFTTVGLPGTSIFIAKLAFFVSLSSFDLLSSLLFAFIFLVILPVFFIRLFLTISGGSISLKNSSYFDLNQKDIFILLTSIVFTIIFGFYPSIIA
jgi:NADH:ubiquinone oxidoreductase subunit 4 (subunit M)